MKKGKETDQLILEGTEESEMLTRLSDRVEKAVQTIQQLRKERDELREQLTKAQSDLNSREQEAVGLREIEEENDRFKKERAEIRNRIEKVLGNLEALEE